VVNDLLRDQRRSMERARSFSANAAHELRTPLTAVLGEVQVTLRRERSTNEYRSALKGVEAEVTRLAALVDVLLTLARAESGELRPELVTFDLSTVAAEAALAARGRHRRSDRVIHLETRPALARGDPLLARRVLENLIENAVRHAARTVEVRVAVQGEVAIASVKDDGPGFPAAVRARLFERFNREPGSADGFGLGLAIAHALTAAQGGRIRLDDAPGATRFLLELPVAVEAEVRDPGGTSPG
jgi:signal transduction histidine kinase